MFQISLNRHWSVLLDQIPLQLDREGINWETDDGERGGEGGGGAIIRGRQLIEGVRLLFEEIRYITISCYVFSEWIKLLHMLHLRLKLNTFK